MMLLPLALSLLTGPPDRGAETWREATAIVEQAVARRLFPGAVVVIGRRDSILFARGFGRTSWDRTAKAPDPGTTRWDLASLTKVVATTAAITTLVDGGEVELDDPVSRYLPRFTGPGKDAVTIRMLLDHTSGLPAFAPLYRAAGGRSAMIDGLYAVPLSDRPGRRRNYSDLNAILLGLVVEAVSGEPLDRFAERAVFSPLGMRSAGFAVSDRTRTAPSIVLGGRVVPGTVSDPNARAMGVVGHAGLFASGLDVAHLAQAWLGLGAAPARDSRWVGTETIRRFIDVGGGSSALGWEAAAVADPDRSPYGRHATATTFGHTGWTGTFLWFDPARDLFMVLLTNRSLGPNNRASFRAMRELRARLSDAVATAVPARCVPLAFPAC